MTPGAIIGSTDPNPSNGACTINVAASSFSAPTPGTTATLTISITFKAAFQGAHDTWLSAEDQWLNLGTYGVPLPVGVMTAYLPNAATNTLYSQQLAAAGGGGGYTWSLAQDSPPLPGWLTLSMYGRLSGTPLSQGGPYNFIGMGLFVNCGHPTPPGSYINQAWLTAFGNLLQDMKDNGITQFGFRPGMLGTLPDSNSITVSTSSELCSKYNVCAGDPSPCIEDSMFPLYFVASYPYPQVGGNWVPTNRAYNCFPSNNLNFMGWDKMLDGFNQALQKAAFVGVDVILIDLSAEARVYSSTTLMRLIYDIDDNHGYTSIPNLPACSPSDPRDILAGFRCVAQQNGVDPGVVTYSFADYQTTIAGGDCPSGFLNATARIKDLGAFTSALNGQEFGTPPTTSSQGFLCANGSISGPVTLMNNGYQSLPNVVLHDVYPCLYDSNNHCAHDSASIAATRTEALKTFDDLHDFIYNNMPGAKMIILETHSPTSKTEGAILGGPKPDWGGLSIPYTCEGNPAGDSRATFLGLLQSNLNGNPGGTILNPFNQNSDSCYPMPAEINSHGYILVQQ
jgi:hypothetical protein